MESNIRLLIKYSIKCRFYLKGGHYLGPRISGGKRCKNYSILS